MTNAVIPADFESAWLAECGDLLARAATVTTVNNDYSLEVAGEVQTAISKAVKRLESERKSITAPLDDAKKQIMAQEKKLAAPLNTELARLKALTSAYATECARRIEEERRRRELEERRAAEAAVAIEDNPFAPVAPTPVPAAAPMPPTVMPKTSANRMVERWDFAVVDANAVPRELCSPDEKKIRAFLAARKAEGYKADQLSVKGLEISATVQVQSR
jgi:hypothetical protein